MDGQTVESDAWAVISNLRDQHPRVPNDCPTDYIVEALAAAGLLAASAPGSVGAAAGLLAASAPGSVGAAAGLLAAPAAQPPTPREWMNARDTEPRDCGRVRDRDGVIWCRRSDGGWHAEESGKWAWQFWPAFVDRHGPLTEVLPTTEVDAFEDHASPAAPADDEALKRLERKLDTLRAVTELREQIARAIANSPLSGTPEYALADSVMAAVGPLVEQLRQAEVSRDAYRDERDQTQRERDEARASVEHLRGDYRRIRKDRDRLLLAWRSARRRALRLRGEQDRLLRPAVSPPSKAPPKESAPLADLADALLARYDIRERGETAAEPDGAAQIVAERHRVVTAKGYDAAHDDRHVHGELLDAARCYFNQGLTYFAEHTNAFGIDVYSMYDQNWPWWDADDPAGWDPSSSPVMNLVKAGQFIAAEIDRLQRAERGDQS